VNPVAAVMDFFAPPPGESKSVFGLDYLGSSHIVGADVAGLHDRDNFTTNRITVAEFNDRNASSEAAALTISTAWACVNLLAGTQASLPRMVYRTASDGQRTVAADHPLFDILRDSPNADQTGMDFF
jgi:hypothetical protein